MTETGVSPSARQTRGAIGEGSFIHRVQPHFRAVSGRSRRHLRGRFRGGGAGWTPAGDGECPKSGSGRSPVGHRPDIRSLLAERSYRELNVCFDVGACRHHLVINRRPRFQVQHRSIDTVAQRLSILGLLPPDGCEDGWHR